ncbi:GFM2 family protein [Megaselia abdita]
MQLGKTTTTERMLFYSGKTSSLGEVHHGNTITDYLAQERERGITICSSAVTFWWNKHRINLLDTPGHIDFTMEVEQSLHAVDGVVVVLDGSAGVEAQTTTVWAQADRHSLPKIVFVNKMDRPDANFEACVDNIKDKFDVIPAKLQQPVKDSEGNLSIIDLINLNHIKWNSKNFGVDFKIEAAQESFLEQAIEGRNEIIDQLSGIDDGLAEAIINSESFDSISNEAILRALRKATLNKKIVPVVLGSAYKNIGIQPLMNTVVNVLPAPSERNENYNCFGDDFVGKVFKIVHDKQRGPLTLVRVFRGDMKKGMRMVTSSEAAETLQKIYEPLADEYREIGEISAGGVGVCSGLKNTITGDLLTSSTSSLKSAESKLAKTEDLSNVFSLKPHIPDAVYFCSIEPPSISFQTPLEIALKQLQREDPSLRVVFDETTGQTVLGGMGELHMEVIKSRILTEYKIDADLGPLQIAYKETIESELEDTFTIEKEIAGAKQSVSITMSLVTDQKDLFKLDNSPENAQALKMIRPKTLQMIKKGALGALERGPRVGGQVIGAQVKLHKISIGRGTADSFLMSAAGQCVQRILNEIGTKLLEPIMDLQIIVPSERVSAVLGDLSRRRAVINDVLPKGEQNKQISVHAPLAELSGYSSSLRTISSGTASMTMQPYGFQSMNSNDELVAIRRAQGLE